MISVIIPEGYSYIQCTSKIIHCHQTSTNCFFLTELDKYISAVCIVRKKALDKSLATLIINLMLIK